MKQGAFSRIAYLPKKVWKSESEKLIELIDRRRILLPAACAVLSCAVTGIGDNAAIKLRIITAFFALTLLFFKRIRKLVLPSLAIIIVFSFYYDFSSKRPENLPTGNLTLTGTISNELLIQENKSRTIINLEDCFADGDCIDGKIRLYVYKTDLWYEVGDVLYISNAKLSVADGVVNPNGFDFNSYLFRNGITLVASANAENIMLKEKNPSLKRCLLRIRRRLASLCDEVFSESSDVMKAVLLGDRSGLSDSVYDDFSASGISHLIALSGLHVSAIAMMLEFLLKRIRCPRTARYTISVIALILYAIMTGASNSTIRAVLMYAILCATTLAGYYSDTLPRLCWVLIIQLGINPLLINDTGFALSYASVAAILCFNDTFIYTRKNKAGNALNAIALSAKTSFSVQIVTFPLLAAMFYSVPLLSVPVNVLCVPLAMLALYIGAAVLAVSCISVTLAHYLAYPAKLIWLIIKNVSAIVSKLPFSSVNTSAWNILLYVFFIAAIIFGCAYISNNKNRRLAGIITMFIIIVISLLPAKPIDHLRITFLAVGEADSAVFDAQGHTYVVDCGKDNGIAADYLTSSQSTVSGIFITHADIDHYGGSADILARYPHAKVYLPDCWDEMSVTDELNELLKGKNVKYLSQGDTVKLSKDIYAEVLWPTEGLTISDDNSGSLVLNVIYNDYSILMMADIPDKYDELACADADVIKISHHGSKYATTEKMLNIVTPEIAVISVGNNSYGHPTNEVITRLENVGAEIYRTDEMGAVIIDVYSDGSTRIKTMIEED